MYEKFNDFKLKYFYDLYYGIAFVAQEPYHFNFAVYPTDFEAH